MEQIGEGGMGVVYRARYVVNNREVALKMVPADVTDKTALARFEREMAVLKDLRHPNIVRCFGGVCEDKRRFYAMELVEGGSLEDVLQRRGRLPAEQVVEYGLQMCAALECSHRHGVIHRDVKPGNFLIAANGQVKLSDFGLASVAAQRKITHAGKTAGTFLYMSPEQIRGGEVTPQTDLYALGCVLFELLTGRPPFTAETPAATLHLHCRQPAPRVADLVMDCPVVLDQLVSQLLEKDPARRPGSAVEVARQLRSVTQTVTVVPSKKPLAARTSVRSPAGGAATRAEPPTQSASAVPLAREQAVWLMVAGLAAAVLVATWLAQAYWSQRQLSREWEGRWVDAAQNSRFEIREAALRALGHTAGRTEHGSTELTRALSDPSTMVRVTAVRALGEAGAAGRSHLADLKRLQRNDPEEHVRQEAARAISKIEAAPKQTDRSWLLALIASGAVLAACWAYLRRRIARPKRAAV